MHKKTSVFFAGIATLVLLGCSDSPVAPEETDITSSSGESNISISSQTAVEGIWLLTKEESEFDTLEFSYTDKSKYLTNYVLMLNNNGSGVIKTFGIQFSNGVYSKTENYEQTESIAYTTNGSYLIVNDDALKFSNSGNELILESSDSKRYFKSYTDLLPLENWEQENIFEYGFEPLTDSDFIGNWKTTSTYADYSTYNVLSNGLIEAGRDDGTWSFGSNGELTIDMGYYSESGITTYDAPMISNDGAILALGKMGTSSKTIWRSYNY